MDVFIDLVHILERLGKQAELLKGHNINEQLISVYRNKLLAYYLFLLQNYAKTLHYCSTIYMGMNEFTYFPPKIGKSTYDFVSNY